ncbi:MAG: DUF624 domain-containing protein [Clostridia bacterium]|nr:DUF624 domain-containing protein [Clostridia bacterium]
MSLNLLFFLVNLPVFALFARLATVGGTPYQAPVNILDQPLRGILLHTGETPLSQMLSGTIGVQLTHKAPTLTTHILLGIGLLTLLTFGIGTAAMTYIQRNFVRSEPTDLSSDFFSCIKRNWKNAMVLGLVDVFFLFVICFDLFSYVYAVQSFGFLLLLYLTFFLSVIYLVMRPYMYLMTVTFDIKLTKIIKNAWILAISGIWRNLFCGVFALLVIVLNMVTFAMIPSLGVVMLFVFTVSFAWFFQIYGAWPVVKKHMIDPYYEEADTEREEEAVFLDRG